MKVNILDSVINIILSNNFSLKEDYILRHRANSMGDALEKYVLDSFAGTIKENDEILKIKKHSEVFSYKGNDSNPSDAMIKEGAAIEVKKIQSRTNHIQLNSSYPKAKLYSSNPKLNKAAIEAEEWNEKDFIYAIGVIKDSKLKELALVDGEVYCAGCEIYENNFDKLKTGISNIEGIDFSETRELGRVNKIDPLGITSLRIRGMWLIENPFVVFNYIYTPNHEKDFNLFVLIPESKYKETSRYKELESLSNVNSNLKIESVNIKNPNNPAQLIDCKKITFAI